MTPGTASYRCVEPLCINTLVEEGGPVHIDRDSTTMAKVEKAYAPYDEYAQCHQCGWFGSVGEFAGHVRARHPQHH